MKTIILENQRGLLFKNGRFVKLLNSGKYSFFGDRTIELVSLDKELTSKFCSLDLLLCDENIKKQTAVCEVADNELVLHFVNGRFVGTLQTGKYAFWSVYKNHEFRTVDISTPDVSGDIPEYILASLPPSQVVKIEVGEFLKARLYFNKRFNRLLDSGTYYFWNNKIAIDYAYSDVRLTQLNITGQEILTKDKVSTRINLVCMYRITDFVKAVNEIDDYEKQIHVLAQLALRDYVGRCTMDEILDNKEDLSKYIFERMKAKEAELYVEITEAGVKDIILPGEIRDTMNTVLIAEKKAQANVIARREEVASTRSLLNTAKLMDENKTLYKLKELEYIERICDNVGNITLQGNSDVLSQLTSILQRNN